MDFFIWIWLSQLGSAELAIISIAIVITLAIGGILLLCKLSNTEDETGIYTMMKNAIFLVIALLFGVFVIFNVFLTGTNNLYDLLP